MSRSNSTRLSERRRGRKGTGTGSEIVYPLHRLSTVVGQRESRKRRAAGSIHKHMFTWLGGTGHSYVARSFMAVIFLLAALGCNERNAAQEPKTHLLLDASPSRIDMGEVASGGRKQATFSLTNSGSQAVELAKIESSCPCLTVDVPSRIAPGEQICGRANLDLRDEPDFTGDLAIEITGWTRAGKLAFLVTTYVSVPLKSER